MIAILGTSVTSLVSCKDFEPDVKTEIQAELQEIIQEEWADMMFDLDEFENLLNTKLKEFEDKLALLKECECDSDRISSLELAITELKNQIQQIDDLASRVEELEKDKGYLTKEDLENLLPDLLAGLGCNCTPGENAGLTEQEVKDLIEGYLKEWITSDELTTKLNGYYTKSEIDAIVKGYYTQEEIDKLVANYVKASEFSDKVKALLDEWEYITDEDLQKELTTLRSEMGGLLQDEMALVDAKLESMKQLLKSVLNSMITSIEINATENPIFGGAALPADVRTTVLAAYYGKTAEAIVFPSDEIAEAIGFDIVQDWYSPGETLFNAEEGNAGTLYLTINPNTVDFAGQTVDLVTSRGDESPIKLSELQPSNKELSFGYTRSGDNGFYEAAATLSIEDIDAVKSKINFNNLKDAAQDVLKDRSKTSLSKLAATLFSESSDILPAYAVKASWVNGLDANNPETVSILSQYALAATAVQPLSFNFMKDTRYNIPGIERVEKAIGRQIDNLFNQIKDVLPDFSSLNDVKIGKIELSELTKEKLQMDLKITIPAGELTGSMNRDRIELKDDAGNHIGWAEITDIAFENEECTITYHLDLNEQFVSIIDDINNSLDLEQLQEALNSLSGLSNVGSDLDGIRDNIKNKLIGYLDRLNNRFGNLVGSVNTSLQPCMLFIDNDGTLGRVTASSTGLQIVGNAITLIPTSYTAELFAPAFKKFIAVTAINGSTSGCAAINKANADKGFATVLPGASWQTLELSGLEKGNTYEITYSAIDYSGNTCTKQYYISVK